MTENNDEQIPSFKQFDYRVRMNKGTERRMLVELFRRLVFFESIANYRYIGFGATTFADFILFHKELNIGDMISIEKYTEYEKRCDFNKPYDCIKIRCGESNDILPELTWDKRVIAWLDYDGRLDKKVKQDIDYVVSRLRSGSMFIVTVYAGGYRSKMGKTVEQETKRLRGLFERHSGLSLPMKFLGKDLQGLDMARTTLGLINDFIKSSLRERNGLNLDENTMLYLPLTNFVYQDGAQMLTAGGLFYEAKDQSIVDNCHFENLPFTQPSEDDVFYEIRMPVVTPRERHYLDKKLPLGTIGDAKDEVGLTQEEIDNYLRFYRYCPSYAEVGLI